MVNLTRCRKDRSLDFQITCQNMVITTMLIRSLDDPIWCVQCVVADLRALPLFWVPLRGDRDERMLLHPISSLLTQKVYLLPFLSYLAGSKCVSARPPTVNVCRWNLTKELRNLVCLTMVMQRIVSAASRLLKRIDLSCCLLPLCNASKLWLNGARHTLLLVTKFKICNNRWY